MATHELPKEWRRIGPDACAWFAAPSLARAADLVGRLPESGPSPDVAVRGDGVRVRLPLSAARASDPERAWLESVSAAAGELGLAPDPSQLQTVRLRVDSQAPEAIMPFWRACCGYEQAAPGVLADPLRRQPAVSVRRSPDPRPLRQRIHIDSVRPADAVAEVRSAVGGAPYGAYGLTLADADGNEIDVVPGDSLSGVGDWQVLFGAMTCYPVTGAREASEFVAAVAQTAGETGVPLLIDVRPEGVVLDSGKDAWEGDDDGAAFAQVAARLQTLAHDQGLRAATSALQFVQLGIDAVDIEAVRAFWTTALAYEVDERSWVTDVCDPRRHDPVIIFQQMDPDDEARRRQRNRTVVELILPHEAVRGRIAQATATGGQVVRDVDGGQVVADPEGNEVVIYAAGR